MGWVRTGAGAMALLALVACGAAPPSAVPPAAVAPEPDWFLTPVDLSGCEPTWPPRPVAEEEVGAGGFGPVVPAPEPVVLVEPTAPRNPFTRVLGARPGAPPPVPVANTEAFPTFVDAAVHATATDPVSTFAADVDTASYAIVRRGLRSGQLPAPDAVRVEEMVNYFPYDLAEPAPGGPPLQPTLGVMATPWNPDTRLVQVALQGRRAATVPPLDLVFLIDTSGSMANPEKLPLLQESFRLLLDTLRPEDEVAIVTYAGSSGLALPPTPASDRTAILAVIDRLGACGSTAGARGLEQAYAVARAMADPGDVSRVILATDGDFNVGLSDTRGLEAFIAEKRETGAYLSVLGFGRGNLDDATMQALAQAGNGTAAFIDTRAEARKVLVDQVSAALVPLADDVKIQVEWDPAAVSDWRLIGYETRALETEEFDDDAVDAGEVGLGHAVTALYEVTPVPGATGPLGLLRLRWKEPGERASRLIEQPIDPAFAAGPEARFAAAVAGWGQLLRGSPHVEGWTFADAARLARANRGPDPYGWRAEAVELMGLSAEAAALAARRAGPAPGG